MNVSRMNGKSWTVVSLKSSTTLFYKILVKKRNTTWLRNVTFWKRTPKRFEKGLRKKSGLFSPFSILLIITVHIVITMFISEVASKLSCGQRTSLVAYSTSFGGRDLCQLIYISQGKSIMLKNRIYKIANNPSFDFFWHNGEKIVQDALSFRLF